MILIGQYDSPFVRRVAIALRLYGMEFEHRPWSTFGDAEQVARFNPLRRVPTLVLDDGEVLIESMAILDHLDEVAGPAAALIPQHGPERRHALKVCALATGLADKAVSLFYERAFHPKKSQAWIDRCRDADRRCAGGPRAVACGFPVPVLVRSRHRSCRHSGCLRASVRVRGASRPSGSRSQSRPRRPRRPLRSPAGVSGDRTALPAAGLSGPGRRMRLPRPRPLWPVVSAYRESLS